jgi:hypothetical protein
VATIDTEDPLAVAVVQAIHTGDLATLKRLLVENPGLATARLGDDDPQGMSRSLLHVATDWPGHFPNGAASVRVPGPTSTGGSAARTPRRPCTGRRAATTWRCSMR